MTDDLAERAAPTIQVTQTRVGVNFGDHGQDVTTGIEVDPDTTVADLVAHTLMKSGPWTSDGVQPDYEGYVTIRLAKPLVEAVTHD
jgi:hypothetical protein